eukprot:1143818-Pelagomonas_calceolata.AAC.3
MRLGLAIPSSHAPGSSSHAHPSRQSSCPTAHNNSSSSAASWEQQQAPAEDAKASACIKKPIRSRSFLFWLLGRGRGPLPPIFTLPALVLDPGPLPVDVESHVLPGRPTFRYWIDFQVLNSPSSAALLERAFRMCVISAATHGITFLCFVLCLKRALPGSLIEKGRECNVHFLCMHKQD